MVSFGDVMSSRKNCSGSTTISSMMGMVTEGGAEVWLPAGKVKRYTESAT